MLNSMCDGVYVTPGSGDGGVDIVITYRRVKYAIQCKHHANPVGPADLRQLRGIVSDSDEYARGIFVSLNGYTLGAVEENNKSKRPCILWDREKLIQISKVKDLSVFL